MFNFLLKKKKIKRTNPNPHEICSSLIANRVANVLLFFGPNKYCYKVNRYLHFQPPFMWTGILPLPPPPWVETAWYREGRIEML